MSTGIPALDVPRAVMQLVLGFSPALVPTALPTIAPQPGDTTLTVSDVRPFLQHTILDFADGLEAPIAVTSVSPAGHALDATPVPGVITLDFTGQRRTGLASAHSTTDAVFTNLIDAIPVDTDAMLENGWPVLSFFVLDEMDKWEDMRSWTPRFTLSCVYQLPGLQPESSPLHPQLWTRDQMGRASTDVAAITSALQRNFTISVMGQSQVQMVQTMKRSLRQNATNVTAPLWEHYLDMGLLGNEINI